MRFSASDFDEKIVALKLSFGNGENFSQIPQKAITNIDKLSVCIQSNLVSISYVFVCRHQFFLKIINTFVTPLPEIIESLAQKSLDFHCHGIGRFDFMEIQEYFRKIRQI